MVTRFQLDIVFTWTSQSKLSWQLQMPILMDYYFLVVYVSATDSLGLQGKRVSQQAVTGLEVRKSYIDHVSYIILARFFGYPYAVFFQSKYTPSRTRTKFIRKLSDIMMSRTDLCAFCLITTGTQVWSGKLSLGRTVLLLWNRSGQTATITATWSDIGLENGTPVTVRDLWKVKSLLFVPSYLFPQDGSDSIKRSIFVKDSVISATVVYSFCYL